MTTVHLQPGNAPQATRNPEPETRKPKTSSMFQFVLNFLRDFARLFHSSNFEADGADSRMPAAAIALTNGRKIVRRNMRSPRIGTHRHLGPETRIAHRYGVSRVRKQIVRNEFVVAFQTFA